MINSQTKTDINNTIIIPQWLKRYSGISIGLIGLIIFFSLNSPHFLKINNIINILLQVSIIAIAAFGMTYVLLLGEIDLSIGSTIAIIGTISALMLSHHFSLWSIIPILILSALILGMANGLLSAALGIPSFIVTVATMGIFRGMSSIALDGASIFIENESFLFIGNGELLSIPLPIWIMISLLIINHFILSKTIFGRQIYLTGGNKEAAIYSGIKVISLKIKVFMVMATMAGISGIILASRLNSAQANAGMGYELDAIAAAVLGGTSLSGGYGTVIGTFIGAIIIGVINNGMNLLNVPFFYQLIVKGLVILIAVYIDVQSKKRRA